MKPDEIHYTTSKRFVFARFRQTVDALNSSTLIHWGRRRLSCHSTADHCTFVVVSPSRVFFCVSFDRRGYLVQSFTSRVACWLSRGGMFHSEARKKKVPATSTLSLFFSLGGDNHYICCPSGLFNVVRKKFRVVFRSKVLFIILEEYWVLYTQRYLVIR